MGLLRINLISNQERVFIKEGKCFFNWYYVLRMLILFTPPLNFGGRVPCGVGGGEGGEVRAFGIKMWCDLSFSRPG